MRRNALICTSGFKRELRFAFSMPENLYKSDFSPKNAILSLFLPFFHCACAETPWFLLPVSKRSWDSDSACPKTYICRHLARKRDFKTILPFFLCACAETPWFLLPVSQRSWDSDSACPKIYKSDFSPKNAILSLFCRFFTAHAQKRPDFYFRFQKGAQIRIQHARKPI